MQSIAKKQAKTGAGQPGGVVVLDMYDKFTHTLKEILRWKKRPFAIN